MSVRVKTIYVHATFTLSSLRLMHHLVSRAISEKLGSVHSRCEFVLLGDVVIEDIEVFEAAYLCLLFHMK